MFRKFLSGFLMFTLVVTTQIGLWDFTSTAATMDLSSKLQLEDGTYEDGQVLVTLASPKKTSLIRKGTVSFDAKLNVEKSWNFGDADVLAENSEQKDFLDDKTLYISKISSCDYSTEELIEQLEDQAYVISVEPDYFQEKMSVTNDTYSDSQWYLNGTGNFKTTSNGVNYTSSQSSSATPVVAVVDTGVDYTNEDLASHMWKNTFSSLSGTYGYDFGDYDSDPMDEDEDGHGTHCAGVISAATDNSKGIAGISKNAQIMALKIFSSNGTASNSSIVAAFNYIYKAQEQGVNISAVNCSWGGGSSSSTMSELIQKIGQKGALFVFASGNDGINQDSVSSYKKECPYDITSDYIVTVGASTTSDTAASYSDYGSSTVSLFAPGSQIISTINSDVFFPSLYSDQKRTELCTFFSTCDSLDTTLYSPSQVGKSSSQISYLGFSHSTEDFYGNTSSGSICVSLSSRSKQDATLSLYYDVTHLDISSSDTYYVASDIGYAESNDIIWEHFSDMTSSPVTYGGRTYLKIVGITGSFQDISELYIDNIAISTANPDTTAFGKYNSMNGTSMAAPIVSGAVAVLASTYSTDTATQCKERLLACVRSVRALSGKCRTGGILDMSKISSATASTATTTNNSSSSTKNSGTSTKVSVKKVKLNKSTATLRYTKKLKLKATITPTNATNKKVKWYVSKTKYAKVTQSGVVRAKKKGIGHTIKVYAKAKDGSGKKAYCKVKIKKKK